jgi:dihydroflavonol-4-reductase
MFEVNVRGAERVLSVAAELGARRIAHVSTIAVFGNTRGVVVDETYTRSGPYTSYYEETKYRAHEIARRLAERGAPIVIAQPGQVYGPGDHSGFGMFLRAFARGRLPLVPFPDLGLNLVHVDDLAAGLVLALDRGAAGQSYALGGEITRVKDAFATLGRVLGRRPPPASAPYLPLRLAALLSAEVREILASSRGVTFWATDARARRELGYAPRDLEAGFRASFART